MAGASDFYGTYVIKSITKTQLYFGTPNSPLEDFVEGTFAPEIKSGELAPVRKRRPITLINPDYYGVVTLANL